MSGRPKLFNSPEELEERIHEYFNGRCNKRKQFISGIPYTVPVPTITGLALFLGFESRQSFYDYEKMDGYSYTIKRARLFIEREYEEQLQIGNTTGAIFALKNMGWKDKTETDITTNGKDVNTTPTIVFKKFNGEGD